MPSIKTSSYPIEIDTPLSKINKFLKSIDATKVFILVDENTKEHCLPILSEVLEAPSIIIEITSGEINKSLDTCNYIWNFLLDNNADRNSVLLNLGGGVIGDMGGFVAATYMRGISFVHVPTTLLSQVDACIGGKLGIDHKGLKNMLGVFRNPSAVYIHTPFLKTLDSRELKSGYAEVIKHSLINSKSAWENIKTIGADFQMESWTKLVTNAVKTKSEIVDQDPEESGIRKILNFGHTIGHAIESYYLDTEDHLLHGEAIAKGMITEAYLSFKMGKINIIELEEINSLLESLYTLPTIQKSDTTKLLELMSQDKKNKAGVKMFSILNGIGACDYNIEVTDELIVESLLF